MCAEGRGRGGKGVAGSSPDPALLPQVDTNQDRLVTLEEFLASTQRKEFGDTAEGWEVRTWRMLRAPTASYSSPNLRPLGQQAALGLSCFSCPRRQWRCTRPIRRRS